MVYNGLKFWITNINIFPLLALVVHDLLTAGKRNWRTKSLEKSKMNLKCRIVVSRFLLSRLLVNISGSSAL